MSAQSRSFSIPWWGVLFALGGLAWCAWMAFPTGHPSPCQTSGCSLFSDGRVGGISLWWVGGACFFLLSLLCLRGMRRAAFALASLAVLLDAFLLIVMFFTAPCLNCLIVAAFFGLTCWALRPTQEGWFVGTPGQLILLPIWFGLLLANLASVGNEALPRWALANAENTTMRLYFAPSCKYCREALLAWGHTAALYPVAETEDDPDAIRKLEALLLQKVPMAEALERCRDPKEPLPAIGPFERGLLSVRLLRNRAAVLKQGFTALPLIEINGMPSLPKATGHTPNASPPGQPTESATAPPSGGDLPLEPGSTNGGYSPRSTDGGASRNQDAPLPWEVDSLGQCGRDTAVPCP